MSDDAIRTSIRQLAGTHLSDSAHLTSCTVESVDVASRTCLCTLIDGKAENEITASLMASVDDGLLIIPSVGSTVKVIFSDYGTPFVCQYSEMDSIVMRGGDLGGLVKVNDLTSRLNLLEKDINSLKTLLSSWIPVPNDGGSALKVTLSTWISHALVETLRSDIENTSITHG